MYVIFAVLPVVLYTLIFESMFTVGRYKPYVAFRWSRSILGRRAASETNAIVSSLSEKGTGFHCCFLVPVKLIVIQERATRDRSPNYIEFLSRVRTTGCSFAFSRSYW